ncbi:serpin-ZX [Helianthus annuus]|uniref:serpin-ZX n=1 Tax=Helianthus annuus TaxID=4232 RepID=UPI000B8F2B28|nr:serpin-ZX [Helianthus annuus]
MEFRQSIKNQTGFSITFATHLLSKKFQNSNVVFSPLSMHVILSLLAAGSEGRTLDQLLAFLKAGTTNDLNSLYSQLVPLIFPGGSPRGGPRLLFANGVWVEKTLSLKPSFKNIVDTVYKASCNQVDFRSKAVDQVASEINLWTKKQTNGLIKKLVSVKEIDKFTMLIIANVVYFKGAWNQKFDRSDTKDSDFHLLDGRKVRVPFMTSKKKQFVRQHIGFKVLGLPYSRGQDKRQFTMYFFLPDAKDGLQSLIRRIDSTNDFFYRHIPHKKVEVGKFLIPKFKITFDFEASQMLKELGLVLPFENLPFKDGDGFPEMVDSSLGKKLYVSSIHHKSFLEMNEYGTEAAAVSRKKMELLSSRYMPKKVDFVADHPFLFVIREDVTGVLLFMGQVINPSIG